MKFEEDTPVSRPPRRTARSLSVECVRCGNHQQVERAGLYNDELFLEVFHELMEYQAAYKDLLRDFRRLEMKWSDAEFMRGITQSEAEGWRTLYECREYAALPSESLTKSGEHL